MDNLKSLKKDTLEKIEGLNNQPIQVWDLLVQPIFEAKHMPITYRQVSLWNAHGLFPISRSKGKWRKFSILEYIWILFLLKLTEHGFTYERLHEIRNHSFLPSDLLYNRLASKGHLSPKDVTIMDSGMITFNIPLDIQDEVWKSLYGRKDCRFADFLVSAIELQKDGFIHVYSSGPYRGILWTHAKSEKDYQSIYLEAAQNSAIVFSIQSLINEFLGTEKFKWEKIPKLNLTKAEIQIVGAIREKGLKEVLTIIKNDNPSLIKKVFKSKKMLAEDVFKMIFSKKYSDFQIITEDSEVFTVQYTEKIKL